MGFPLLFERPEAAHRLQGHVSLPISKFCCAACTRLLKNANIIPNIDYWWIEENKCSAISRQIIITEAGSVGVV